MNPLEDGFLNRVVSQLCFEVDSARLARHEPGKCLEALLHFLCGAGPSVQKHEVPKSLSPERGGHKPIVAPMATIIHRDLRYHNIFFNTVGCPIRSASAAASIALRAVCDRGKNPEISTRVCH